jgi:NAD(P)-dependent dehydrogenase (short-subunit alcohol dehydrogenase family)
VRLEGNSAIVTGGTGGLGGETVRRLAAAGAAVVVADVADDTGKLLADELGDKVRYVRANVTDEGEMLAAIAAAEDMAPLRVSVAAHGGRAAGGRLVARDGSPLPLDGFRDMVEDYLTGTFNVMRLAAAAMARNEPDGESGRGVIINTASIAAFEGQIGQLPYAAAKGGVVGMTIVAARDLSPVGVRVVTIAPGTFLTPAYGMTEEEASERFAQGVQFPRRMGRPAEYAALVQSVVENDYLNGETIRLDGALRFGPK